MKNNTSTAELTITLKSDVSDAIVSFKKGDKYKEKCVSISNLISELSKKDIQTTGIIPPNTRLFSGTSTNYRIVLEASAKIRKTAIWVAEKSYQLGNKYKPEIVELPFPICLFYFRVEQGKLLSSRLYCIKDFLKSTTDDLYNFPYGNIYDGDGRICWGEAKIPPNIHSPMLLYGLINLFFEAPFNGDLYAGFRSVNIKDVNNFWDLIKYMKEQKIFPSKSLVASKINLSDLIKG